MTSTTDTTNNIDNSEESLLQQYEENSRLMYIFFDWRHKVMVRFFLSIGALALCFKWITETYHSPLFDALVFLMATFFACLSAAMDRVNQNILNMCYENGLALDKLLYSNEAIGIYRSLHKEFAKGESRGVLNYRMIMRIMYSGTAICFFVAAILRLALSATSHP